MKAPRLCGICRRPLSMAEKRASQSRCSDCLYVINDFDWWELRFGYRVSPHSLFTVVGMTI